MPRHLLEERHPGVSGDSVRGSGGCHATLQSTDLPYPVDQETDRAPLIPGIRQPESRRTRLGDAFRRGAVVRPGRRHRPGIGRSPRLRVAQAGPAGPTGPSGRQAANRHRPPRLTRAERADSERGSEDDADRARLGSARPGPGRAVARVDRMGEAALKLATHSP